MEFQYVPKACKADPATWSGSVTLKVMSFDDAAGVTEAIALAGVDAPEAVTAIRQSRAMVKAASGFVAGLELKRLRDGKEYKSWADLCAVHDKENDLLIIEIAGAVLSGPAEGNG